MSLKERTINVDIMTKEYTKLKYKQGDSNQTLKFKFYKNGSELDLTGYVAGIFYEKPNNEVLEKTGNISANTITTTITSGILNTSGIVKTEIFLTKNDEVSISFTILIEVEASIDKNAAVQEKEEWDIIKDLLIKADNIAMIDDSLTATNKTWSSSKISLQIKDIANSGGAVNVPENVALVTDITIDNTTEDYIPIMSSNGTEYKLTISNDGIPVIKDVNGKVVFTCSTGGSNDSDTPSVPCTGITLSASTLSFTTIDTQTLTVTKTPSDTTDIVTWSTSPTGICTVSDGVVTPVANGNCTITVSCGSQSATCDVTVTGLASEIVNNTLYELNWTDGIYISKDNGSEISNNNWSATQYLSCAGVDYITTNHKSSNSTYNVFYDINKQFISNFSIGNYNERVSIPTNAVYFRLSIQTSETSNYKLIANIYPDATWTNGVSYDLGLIADKYISSENGSIIDYASWSMTDYLNCVGASKLTINNPTKSTSYCAFYDSCKVFLNSTTVSQTTNSSTDVTIPDFACYFVMSNTTEAMNNVTITPYE